MPLGVIPDGEELTYKWGFTSQNIPNAPDKYKGRPCLSIYNKKTEEFLVKLIFDAEETMKLESFVIEELMQMFSVAANTN